MKSLWEMVFMLMRYEFTQAFRSKSQLLLHVSFFSLAVFVFSLSLGPYPIILEQISGSLIWILTLFASSLSLPPLFKNDFEDGTLQALFLTPLLLRAYVTSKILSHWFLCEFPIMLLAPIVGFCLNLSVIKIGCLLLTLSIGTPILSFIGIIGSTITLGSHRTSFLIPLIVLPLYIPVLIFGVSSMEAALTGFSLKAHLYVLCGLFFLYLPLTLLISTYSLKQSLKNL